ncbi:unnamed protein product [Macrosiphum euphorbiae]|uniref:Regulatory protein zeste n=1 Tax=Macrosiphum euphorbiae TaxID=13131 RepID=A0AAV0WR84_9HEMI|nr:unnamed protein product [Macrosiphum euphorbiae]
MSSEKKIKSGSLTGDQKQTIIDFMESHPHLAKGKFSASFTNEKATNLWQELTASLNSIPGSIKEWKAWRRTWHDMKGNAKSKKVKLNFRTTGGGESIATPLKKLDESLVGIIGEVPIIGDPRIMESSVSFDFQKPSTSTT